MKLAGQLIKLFENVGNKLKNEEFVEKSKMKKQDFTRNRIVGFAGTVLIVLSKTGKSLSSAIRAFKETLEIENEKYTNQAFSKGRMRIKWEAFRELFVMTRDHFYENYHYKTWNGFRLSAIDGTKINLPYSESNVENFGIQKSTGELPQSLGSTLYDVLNKIIIDATASPCNANERELAKQHLEILSEIKTDKELILFDRGYPSAELISFIEEKGFSYLMRADDTFVRGMVKKVSGDDCVITHKFVRTKVEVKLRLIRIELTNNKNQIVTEWLITNVFDKSIGINDFSQLYHLRWGIESKYDDIKNKLQLQNFSGISSLAVLQDFYATMFLSNIASMMIFENSDEIDKLHNSKDNKYKYVANVNNTISLLKENVVALLVTDYEIKRRKLLKHIYSDLVRAVVPIRNGRAFPRHVAHPAIKFHQNQRA